MSQTIEWGVTCAVDLLLPKGSCSTHRWLTFDFEAETVEGETFTWTAQYSAPSGYVHWRTLLPGGVPHTELSDRASWYTPRAKWVPVDSLTVGDYQETCRGEAVIAPSFVIAAGAHDSCWRDNATRLSGYPMVQEGTWRNDRGEDVPNMNPTRYFQIYHDTTVRVKGISIKGPVAKSDWVGVEAATEYKTFTDGEWVNDTELTDVWAMLYGISKLSQTVGIETIDTRIDVTFTKGKYGTRSYKERRLMGHYRFRDGKVVCKGVGQENPWFLKEWGEEVEPYLLDQMRVMLDMGFTEKEIPIWKLQHLFPSVQDQ